MGLRPQATCGKGHGHSSGLYGALPSVAGLPPCRRSDGSLAGNARGDLPGADPSARNVRDSNCACHGAFPNFRRGSRGEMRAETEQMRSSLLSAVSHDLRTPLASITGAASSLLSHGNQLDRATQQDLLESIAQEAQRLSRLVNNLLEMTRLESGAVRSGATGIQWKRLSARH